MSDSDWDDEREPIEIQQLDDLRFLTVPARWLRDGSLSYKARGLLVAICSYREGARFTVDDLVANSVDGATSVRSGLQELEACGYLTRTKVRDSNGRAAGIVYGITDPGTSR